MHLSRLHWLSISMLILSVLILGTASVTAQDSDAPEPSMDEQIVGDAAHPANIFGGTQQKPEVKNLYKSVYKSIKVDSDRVARQRTAEHYQYSETEMTAILNGDLGLLRRTQPKAVNYDDLLKLIDKMQATYQKEFNKEQLHQNLFLDSYPQEIFVNGDTSDSGFDVVYDLEILELLLFGDENTSSSGGGGGGGLPEFPSLPDSDSGSETAGPGPSSSSSPPLPEPSETPETSGPETSSEPESTSPETSVDPTPSPTPSETPAETTSETTSVHDPLHEEDGSLNPNACAVDPSFQAMFQAAVPETVADTDAEVPPAVDTGEGAPTTGDSDSGDSETTGDSEDSGNASGDASPKKPSPKPSYIREDGSVESNLSPKEAADWADAPSVCNKIFCLKVRFTNRPDAQYEETTNCIQCHVQYIVKVLRETTSQSLSPGKVSGNLMEPATCKKSLFSGGVSLNFIPIAMPIKTPAASQLVTGVDLSENFEDFLETAWGVDFAKSAKPGKTQGDKAKTSTGGALDDALKYQTTISTPGDNQLEIYEKALATYDKHIEEIRQKFKDSYTAAQFNVSTDFYESLRYEMDQMNFYFQSFRAAIEMAQEVVEERKNNLTAAS